MSREQMVEKAVEALHQWRLDDDSYDIVGYVLDAVLPQVTTVEELEALPSETWLIGLSQTSGPHFWRRGAMDRPDVYLDAYGPFTIWRP